MWHTDTDSTQGFTVKNGVNGFTDSFVSNRTLPKGFSHQRVKTCAVIPLRTSITPRSHQPDRSRAPLHKSMTISRMPTSLSLSDNDLRKSLSRASNMSQTSERTFYNSNASTVPRELQDNTRNLKSREEMHVSKATLPRSGLIKLTALQDEIDDPRMFTEKRDSHTGSRKTKPLAVDHRKLMNRQKTLLRMVDSQNNLRSHENLLALDNESLGSYTFGDLQNTIYSYSKDKSYHQSPNIYRHIPSTE